MFTLHGFDEDMHAAQNGYGVDDAAPASECESELCRQHYGEAQRVHMLSRVTGEVVDTRTLCLKARRVAEQCYGVTLADDPCEKCGGSGYVYANSDACDGAESCRACNADESYVTLKMAA